MKISLHNMLKGAMMLSLALAVGCTADDPNFDNPDNTINPEDGVNSDSNSGDGYLALSDVLVSINPESEAFSTRSGSSYSEAGDDYLIYIHDEDTGEEFYRNTYLTTKNMTENYVLPVGNYILTSRSIETIPATAWDSPEYTSITGSSFSIGADKQTSLTEEVVCTMANIKTSVEMSADLKALFKADDDLDLEAGDIPLQTVIELGDKSMTYSSSESRSGYFAEQADNSTFTVTLSGMYNTAADGETPEYAAIEWKQNIASVAAGQYRKISIQIANYNNGVLEIKFVVTTWVYDETLGIQMSQAFYTSSESEIYDPDSEASDPYSPTITIDGEYGLNYYIYPSAFDESTSTYSPLFDATIVPQTGSSVSEVLLMLSSTNTEYESLMDGKGYGSKTLWDSSNGANVDVADVFTFTSDGMTDDVSLSITYDAMKQMNEYRGTHTLKFIIKDSENRRSVTNVLVHSVASDVLDIVWQPDKYGNEYSFDDTHEIMYTTDENYVELPVVFVITSKTGLTKLTIDINSVVLTADELANMSLAQSMDLINPATDKMSLQLGELGFPVGDQIEGETELTFDITSFMPLLAVLSDVGSKDATSFVITAGDDSGECVKTLSVVRK